MGMLLDPEEIGRHIPGTGFYGTNLVQEGSYVLQLKRY